MKKSRSSGEERLQRDFIRSFRLMMSQKKSRIPPSENHRAEESGVQIKDLDGVLSRHCFQSDAAFYSANLVSLMTTQTCN